MEVMVGEIGTEDAGMDPHLHLRWIAMALSRETRRVDLGMEADAEDRRVAAVDLIPDHRDSFVKPNQPRSSLL